ncbi:Murein DD-endopeptidase MepM and murein hydrolase activator NlpD, contain LysM domain [Gracilibacillus ureilyticus]|uniref:Murein DD-endopeptidase MepM and murein hydrolase activator NlpD, contain LysM domain n=1 Tax=Gracilibacillus ureilyticus TaxID=531814 RepID=A0A1H9UZG4_9BACI|nr:M23 family metallopeptidase [Gracilibacillus ureilyticus]SES14447.1 Murein DD-endopeptidase MepM and murein hydrolase activator NlpD, contain LysM domain [Gracilibacillus ureilyticus]
MRESKIQNIKKTVRNTMLAGLIGFGIAAPTVSADETALSEIYHVYVDGEHIGIVDDQQQIANFVERKLENLKEETQHSEYTYTIDENITYVPETVFTAQTTETEVIDYLEEELTVKVEASALIVGGETVGYFANEKEAEQVIQAYKEKFVSAEVLDRLENSSESEAISVGESRITDVSLTADFSTKDEKVAAAEVLTVQEGLTLLEKGTLENKKYTVAEGDVLGSIASKHDLTLDQLMELNPGLTEDSLIQIGDELNVTVLKPFVEVIVTEEQKTEETIEFETEIEESESMYKGDEEVKQEGSDGEKEVQYQIQKINGKTVNKEVVKETVTKEAVNEVIVKGTKVVPSRGSGDFHWPAVGGYISSHMGERWGSHHKGIDIAGVGDRSILAADNGTVVSAGWDNGGYGNKIVIDHNNGYRTVYAHLSSISVSAGQTVEKGSTIGVMGTTGNSTGIHLHFEVYQNGSLINPAGLF